MLEYLTLLSTLSCVGCLTGKYWRSVYNVEPEHSIQLQNTLLLKFGGYAATASRDRS